MGKALGPGALERASIYWLTFRGLLLDPTVSEALVKARVRLHDEADHGGFPIVVDASDLRLLDAALWKHLVRGTGADIARHDDA